MNLVSSVFGALTLGLLFSFLRETGIKRSASGLAVLAFAVSHTFWQHAVRAEVYTLTLAFMVGLAWLGARWFRTGVHWYLAAAGFVLGLGLSAHLMVGLFVPGLLWLALRRRLRWNDVLWSAPAFALGVLPLGLLIARDAVAMQLRGMELVRWALFSFEGYDFSGAMFDFRLRFLVDDTFQWAFFLGLQFVGLAGVCGLIGVVRSWKELSLDWAVYVLLLYVGAIGFSFAYRVGDRYVFYLPSYLLFVIWIGIGVEALEAALRLRFVRPKLRAVAYGMLAVLFVVVPLGAYRVGPELVARGITFRDTRHVPGPQGRYFFLWPSLAGYIDARVYAERTLEQAPPGALLLADPILASPLRFLQFVEGMRQDVDVRYCCWDIEAVLSSQPDRPIVLADIDERIYPMDWLQEEYRIALLESVYLLVR